MFPFMEKSMGFYGVHRGFETDTSLRITNKETWFYGVHRGFEPDTRLRITHKAATVL